jgi:hypothetical protein
VVALFNVSDPAILTQCVVVLWRQLAACAFFYCIFMFVNDEERLFRFGKVVSIACTLVMLTAVTELFFPGRQIIPGWIGLTNKMGEGLMHYRAQGIRVGGSFESHGMLADFGTQLILFMVYFAILAKNPMEKIFWFGSVATTIIAILATANRGATSGLILAFILALVFFRRRLGGARIAVIVIGAAVGLVVLDTVLSEKTLAVSVIDRFTNTKFEGMVPENRVDTWGPTMHEALEKPFFGHGPYFDTGLGLTKRMWPHNGYLFYFFTLGLFECLRSCGSSRACIESRGWRARGVRDTPGNLHGHRADLAVRVAIGTNAHRSPARRHLSLHRGMCFGVIVAGAAIARRKLAADESHSPTATALTRSVTSKKS